MYGLEFKTVDESFGIGSCEFESRKRGGTRFFKMITGDRWEVWENGELLMKNPNLSEIESILPQGDFGKKWTAQDFMLAKTFFGEGQHKK